MVFESRNGKVQATIRLDETEAALWEDPDYAILRSGRRAELRAQAREMGADELSIQDPRGYELERWRTS